MSRLPPPRPQFGPLPTLPPVPLPPGGPIPTLAVWKLASANLRQGPTPALVALLDPIDDAIAKYNAAFSPMAKRNMAAAIADGVTAWIKKAKQVSPIMTIPVVLTTLQGNAIKAKGFSAGGHFTKIACVGWAVKTGTWDTATFVQRWDSQNQKWVQTNLVEYTGYPDEDEDLARRIIAMKGAMSAAHSAYAAKHGALKDDLRTLKVFMAPEFFFRGPSGAYSIEKVATILPELRNESSLPKYASWLFVFGTAIGATISTAIRCTKCGNDVKKLVRDPRGPLKFSCPTPGCGFKNVRELATGAMIDNVALIQKGGEKGDDNSYTVAKEFVSHIDFRRVTTTHATGATIVDDWGADRRIELDTGGGVSKLRALPPDGSRDLHSAKPSTHTDERMGGGMFNIAGISFGMEICLDHLKNRLGTQGVQVQLVPSAGASLKQFGCVAGGIAFNVDGLGPHADARVNEPGKTMKTAPAPASASTPFTPKGCNNIGDGNIVTFAPVDVAALV